MKNNNKKRSYFSEMTRGNNDPNFFNKVDLDVIEKNVPRILKDIYYNNILEQDYVYFTNHHVAAAIRAIAQDRYDMYRVTCSALNFYNVVGLQNNYMQYPTITLADEEQKVASVLFQYTTLCNFWALVLQYIDMVPQFGGEIMNNLKMFNPPCQFLKWVN